MAHAMAKSLLFCATSGIQDGTTELAAWRGAGHGRSGCQVGVTTWQVRSV
jgi:hypothetical protein